MRSVGALSLIVVFALAPAAAYAADGSEPSPVVVATSAGVGGYVRPDEGFRVTLDLTPTRLVSGILRLQLGNEVFVQDVELPGGTTKTYVFDLPSPNQERRVTIDLTEHGSAEPIVSQRIPLAVATDAVLVGVAGDDRLLPALDALTSSPFNQDLVPVVVSGGEDITPLDYLVVTDPACCSGDAVIGWIERGGRLVATSAVVAGLGVPTAAGSAIPGTEAHLSSVGSGEVVVWDGLTADADPALWRSVLRSLPPAEIGLSTGWGIGQDLQLFDAAVASGTSASVDLPWLMMALAGYVLIAGPVNFLLLRRFGRVEWAWVTVPAIGLVAVALFVAVGRQQTASLHLSQASVIVETGDRVLAESGVVYFASNEGSHTIGFGPTVSARAAQGAWFASTQAATVERTADGGTDLTFDLPSLGAATAWATWHPEPSGIRLSSEVEEAGVQVAVANEGSNEYWAWGLVAGPRVITQTEPLRPGATADLTLLPGGRVGDPWSTPLADSIIGEVGGSEQNWQRVWPLAAAGAMLAASELGDSVYFFGLTDDPALPMTAGGRSAEARGTALVIVDTGLDAGASAGEAAGELVATDGQVDASMKTAQYVYGASYVGLRFGVPSDVETLELDFTNFGPVNSITEFQLWNWDAGRYDTVDFADEFPASSHRSPGGEVMIRLELSGQEEVFVSSYALTWERS